MRTLFFLPEKERIFKGVRPKKSGSSEKGGRKRKGAFHAMAYDAPNAAAVRILSKYYKRVTGSHKDSRRSKPI